MLAETHLFQVSLSRASAIYAACFIRPAAGTSTLMRRAIIYLGCLIVSGCGPDLCPERDGAGLPVTPVQRLPAIADLDAASEAAQLATRDAGPARDSAILTPRIGIIVNTRGRVIERWIVTSSGNARMDSAAAFAVQEWVFRPAMGMDGSASAVL